MTVSYTVESFDLYVWRGHWVLRSRHDTQEELLAALSKVERGVRPQVRRSTRRVLRFTQPDRPTEARRHRESVADAMTVRAQAMKLYKSSANGTELASIPEERVEGTTHEPRKGSDRLDQTGRCRCGKSRRDRRHRQALPPHVRQRGRHRFGGGPVSRDDIIAVAWLWSCFILIGVCLGVWIR